MLVYNKYLKELGMKKDDFPFDRTEKKDGRYGLDKKYGIVEAQTWNLDKTIVCELYTYIRAFQDNFTFGVPCPYCNEEDGMEKWKKVIDKIVTGLKCYILAMELDSSNFKTFEDFKTEEQALFDQFDEGWKLLGENIRCFWW